MRYTADQVFTPADVPTVTYVYRGGDDALEGRLGLALRTKGMIASLSGPSKTGKTVLVKRTIDPADLITISGASVKSAVDLWSRVLDWMEAPSEVATTKSLAIGGEVAGKVQGGLHVPFFAKGGAEVSGKGTASHTDQTTEKRQVGGIAQVIREIAGSPFTLFLDDFHYIPREVQVDVARQMKEAAEAGVKICTASVPHRSDDVVRGNPELRGRVQAIDFEYWSEDEIKQIAQFGFAALNFSVARDVVDRLAREAFGSPQLMQTMCLHACFSLDIAETLRSPATVEVTDDRLSAVLRQTSSTTDFSSLVDALHSGPKQRGQDRRQFTFTDGSGGDVYRSVLLALTLDPPNLSFRYDELMNRVRDVCAFDSPVGSSVSEALGQMDKLGNLVQPQSKVIEWSEDVLDIADPYFLFYLRCSERLRSIVRPKATR